MLTKIRKNMVINPEDMGKERARRKSLALHMYDMKGVSSFIPIIRNLFEDLITPDGDLIHKYRLKEGIKLIPITIDGLDCSGKETLSNAILEYLTNRKKKAILLSFPEYDGYKGEEIRYLLRSKDLSNNTRAIGTLATYMISNRLEAFAKLVDKINKDKSYKNDVYIIMDRFYLSNFIYGVYSSYNYNDLFTEVNPRYTITLIEKAFYDKLFDVSRGVNILNGYNTTKFINDELIMANESIRDEINLHRGKLEAKEDKDNNEVIERQIKVANVLSLIGKGNLLKGTNVYRLPISKMFSHSLDEVRTVLVKEILDEFFTNKK